MALDFLTGSHRLYKAQTASVLSWLTETGTKCKYLLPAYYNYDALTPLPDDLRPPKRTSIGSSQAPRVGPAYLIDVNDIVPFATLVVEAYAKPTPVKVLKDLGLAISSRRLFSDWYQSQSVADPAVQQSNKGHRHFNSVLEELLNVLTPSAFKSEAIASDESSRGPKSSADIMRTSTNPFDILELEFTALMDQKDDLEDLDCVSETIPVAKPNSARFRQKCRTSSKIREKIYNLRYSRCVRTYIKFANTYMSAWNNIVHAA